MSFIRDAILRWARARQPDFIIGGAETPYLRRHWLLPRNRFFNVYVHEFLRSDDDRALHDHPWLFNCSVLLDGYYLEHRPGGEEQFLMRGDWKFRWGGAPHRIELIAGLSPLDPQPYALRQAWTLFITGPVVRTWGFHCPKRWVPWQEFVDARDSGAIGKGCAE